jgi:hypothetical protein
MLLVSTTVVGAVGPAMLTVAVEVVEPPSPRAIRV